MDLQAFLDRAWAVPSHALRDLGDLAAEALGARSGRILIADYGLTSLLELGSHGPTGEQLVIDGSAPGLCFARDEVISSESQSDAVWVPLHDGSERIGVLELAHPGWSDDLIEPATVIARLVALHVVTRRRYTDVSLRSRRVQPLTLAAEMQWDLLPPLTCSTDRVTFAGILEPAYAIGGDSFDFAVNPGRAEFAIIDAVGHGMDAVLLTVATINNLRNCRREGRGLDVAYLGTNDTIAGQFGRSSFGTGQIGSLQTETGELTWLNAGHPLPLLVRDGSLIGELLCRPSLPMGLGGTVAEIATEALQPGDRVLFHSDGVTESGALTAPRSATSDSGTSSSEQRSTASGRPRRSVGSR